jgi:hypothetical protein
MYWLHLLGRWFVVWIDSQRSAHFAVSMVVLFLLVAFWRLIVAWSKTIKSGKEHRE